MSTTPAEATTSPGRELAARACYVAGLLHHLADAAESSQPGAVGSWMRRVREIHASVREELMTAAVALERAAGASGTTIGAPKTRPSASKPPNSATSASSGARASPVTVTPCSSHHLNPRDPSRRALRPSTTVLRDPPSVARNASVSRHARPSPLAACGPPTIGAT